MSEWYVIDPKRANERMVNDGVRILTSGDVVISPALADQLGRPEYVQFVRSGEADLLGLCAARSGLSTYRLTRYSRIGEGKASGWKAIASLGKRPRRGATVVPHRWDGDVLVLDLSGMPDHPERRKGDR